MKEDTLVLPSLSPVGDKPISALIDDRCTSADGGLLLFQDVERRLNLADRLAACLQDPRQPGKITHRLDEILRFRMLAIVAGYPDGNDCDVLRGDPVFKMALDRPPVTGPALCSQPTVSRIENMPRRTELYRMAQAMLDLYCDSFPVVPNHLTLDLDESFDRGEQQLRKFNAYYYYCVINWIVKAVPAGADSMGSGEAVERGSDAVARSGLAHGVPAAPAP